MTPDEKRKESDDSRKAAIGGTTNTDEKQQAELPPRGTAREGKGTHGDERHDRR